MRNNEAPIRQEMVQVGRLMYEKGFIVANDGNISARLDEHRILITPSGLHKGLLEADQLLLVDESGARIGPSTSANRHLKPTSELPMHLEAYRRRPDIKAVVHAHPPVTVALTIAGIPLADCLLPEVIVQLGLIPTTAYATPSSEENVRAIRDLIPNHDAIVLQRHGSLTVGNDLMQSFMRLEIVEQNARIAFMLAQLGVRHPMKPDEVEKLLQTRRELGLSRPGDAQRFCAVCGVCHAGSNHAQTMRSGENKGSDPPTMKVGPQNLPPIRSGVGELDLDQIQALVSHVVRKTIGRETTGYTR